ncbi:MAG: hypothetical protein ACFCUH_03050 [Flavobacteriales bacterium]
MLPERANTMKEKKDKNASYFKPVLWLKTHSILTLIVICVLSMSCRKEKNRICELYDGDVGYAIGSIESINTSPFKATYKYDYSIDGTAYNGKEKAYGIGQKDETLIGKQFIVIYALRDPSNSDLNTDYLIESEQEFDDFESEFSSAPPSPDFPNNCK